MRIILFPADRLIASVRYFIQPVERTVLAAFATEYRQNDNR
ncbi:MULTISPECIES: hypothetical protein [unclassified Erwinia]|nr:MULTISPECIES: hypothetical protein [unclassified Erwinia]